MLATTTTLGCGMSICVALWTAEIEAAKPKIYRFPGGTMIVQPGPTAAAVKAPATETASKDDRSPSPAIRLASRSVQLAPPPMPPLPDDDQPTAAAASAPVGSDATLSPLDRMQHYQAVYNAIPFSRAEYDANPSYRHDTAVEVLFGQMRPTVIQRGHTTVTVQQPDAGGIEWSPWVYYGRSGWYAPYPAPGYRVFRGW